MKRLILILGLLLAVLMVNAQVDYTARTSRVYFAKGGTGDTVNLAGTNSYKLYVPNFAKTLKLGVELDSVSGDPALQTIIRTSLNFVDWVDVDTILTTDTDDYEIGLLLNPYAQYIEFETTGITNAQTSRYKYNFLIEKVE
jgi:hypothetical protein